MSLVQGHALVPRFDNQAVTVMETQCSRKIQKNTTFLSLSYMQVYGTNNNRLRKITYMKVYNFYDKRGWDLHFAFSKADTVSAGNDSKRCMPTVKQANPTPCFL